MATAAQYLTQLRSLMPRGRVWSWTGLLKDLFAEIATEFALLEFRARQAVLELDPRTASETLDWWEHTYGLGSTGTTSARQAALTSRVVRRQRTRPVDYQNKFAAVLGYEDPADVQVLEISRADAIAMNDDRAIYAFYLYRPPTDPGTYYVGVAQEILDDFVQSHTKGKVIESIAMICDDPYSLCDRDLIGA
jgi:uncharacterized protein YmfQ (DUF2313 family)